MFRLSYPEDGRITPPSDRDTIRLFGRKYHVRPWHHAAAGFLVLAVWSFVALVVMAAYGRVHG